MFMLRVINDAISSDQGLRSMFDEWIYNLSDRASYIQHYVQIFGQETLNRFRARSYYSAPANYGVAFESGWDTCGQAILLGVDMAGLEKLIFERGDIVHVE